MLISSPPSSFSQEQRQWLSVLSKAIVAEFRERDAVGSPASVADAGSAQDGDSWRRIDRITIAADTTLRLDEVNTHLYVNCTSAAGLTMPTATAGMWLTVFNAGSAALTLKTDGGTTIEVIPAGGYCGMRVMEDSGGDAGWVTGLIVMLPSGIAVTTSDFYWDTTAAGPMLKDSNGHYWRQTVNTSGAFVTTDIGTTGPSETTSF